MNAGIEQFEKHLNVSRETIERLTAYEKEIVRWNKTINLVSHATLAQIWTRHFLDSAQIWKLRPDKSDIWLDLGSGAGFPGLVIAILAHVEAPEMKITLVESDRRKAAFLINVSQLLGVTVKIEQIRVEKLAPHRATIISARALAPLEKLLAYAEPHCSDSTIMLFQKGENTELELTQAQKYWTFTVNKTPSVTNSGGVLLQIGGLGRVKP